MIKRSDRTDNRWICLLFLFFFFLFNSLFSFNFIEICNNEWEYYDKEYNFGYKVDVSKINFYDGSIKNILNNIDSNLDIIIFDDVMQLEVITK